MNDSQELASISEGASTTYEKEDDVDSSKDILHVLMEERERAMIRVKQIHRDSRPTIRSAWREKGLSNINSRRNSCSNDSSILYFMQIIYLSNANA